MAAVSQTLNQSRTNALRGIVKPARALEIKDQVALALDTLRKNPLRSALTILGIVIGITTVIAVSSLINGLNENVLGGIRDLGSDTVIAYRFPWASLSRPPSEWFTRKELQPEWAEDIARLPHVKAASPSMRIFRPQFGSGTADVRRGAYRAKNVILQGNQPSIGEIFDIKIEHGRMFNETDAEHRAAVVCLGYDTAHILFPEGGEEAAIGKEVTIDGQLFTVIGTMEKRRQGISGGANPEDNIAFLPVTTLRKLYPNQKDYVIFAKASDPSQVSQAVEEIRDLLRRKRRLSNDKPDDFAIFTSDYFLDLWNKISFLIFLLMFCISAIGLLVGGIGVMNIMLVSVTERTREIGVRKAIGAKRSNIMLQFLIEAVTLSAVGGVLGVTFGAMLSLLMKYGAHMSAQISGFWVVTALVLCAMIGIGFGIYPAWKAARLDPVEALRYE
ncbi:MAG: ABC transporter permease [Acidobacteria bacterium]|nr:ABC transporter permease [Acidobacteriota bacterium]MBS1866159.1 ABC transporter permease [Acidobacteriota bacterium]